jgi:opacity protein-like surface antigen
MKARTGTLAAAIILLSAGTALAQQTSGFYIGGAGGLNWLRDTKIEGGAIGSSTDYDLGWAALGTLGYKLTNGFRFEGELGYRENDVDNAAGAAGQGDASAKSLMANLLYDFNTGSAITPYIGAGLGVARIKFDDSGRHNGAIVDDRDTTLAYQGILGIAYNFSQSLSLGLDYRYFAALDPSFSTTTGTGVTADYRAHTITLALRYFFGAPAPAPMATPVQAPAPA